MTTPPQTDRPKLAALAVVIHNDHLLLVRRKNEPDAGLWGFPGGHVERGETALAAAARELHEETTILATPRSYLTNLDIIGYDTLGTITHHYLLAAVICDYISGQPTAQDDVFEAQWLPFATITNQSIPMSKDVDTLLHLALKQLES
jgi:ADP-ribose pyrophosphatase YjhB (NUDIX family)